MKIKFSFLSCVLLFSQTGFYRPRKLGLSFPRLYDIQEGEAMASALLQVYVLHLILYL